MSEAQQPAIALGGWVNPEPKKTPQAILTEWQKASEQLERAKAVELKLRAEVVEAFPFDHNKVAGTQYTPLANGWRLKLVTKQNYNLADAEGQTDAALAAIERSGRPEDASANKLIAERLVKWKPQLSLKEYELLSSEHRAMLSNCLTITPGAPSLELVEPKATKL